MCLAAGAPMWLQQACEGIEKTHENVTWWLAQMHLLSMTMLPTAMPTNFRQTLLSSPLCLVLADMLDLCSACEEHKPASQLAEGGAGGDCCQE